MAGFRTEDEMMDVILGTAREDDRILAVMLSGSRADPDAPKDIYMDYDIVYLVKDVKPFWNNTGWLEDKFGRIAVMQTPETMSLIPPDNDGKFVFLTIFEDCNRIDLTISDNADNIIADVADGEPAVVLLDKGGYLSAVRPKDGYWNVSPPDEKRFGDCCNEFWWCLNNVAKGIIRDELPYAMDMFGRVVRDMLNMMTSWYIGMITDFSVSAGKRGKYFKRHLPEKYYKMYEATYPDSNYENFWDSVFAACELFRTMAVEIAGKFGYVYNKSEDDNMMKYMNWIRSTKNEKV
ncbi:MAG: aminoglycoside 6-adenylyltransferase [Oscillospiraceae bacterium]|nr:aminoglycoside 6-adenylyltransferase [Oscillospiraceae bacterium]